MHRLLTIFLGTSLGCLISVGCDDTSDNADVTTQALNTLCRKIGTCSDMSLSASDLAVCREAASPLATALVDPDYFQACVSELSCSELQDQETIAGCTDLDPSTLACDGDVLLACTNGGLCREIDCRSICPIVGATFDSCGPSPTYGYEVCICAK
jgi:hypothetical protein